MTEVLWGCMGGCSSHCSLGRWAVGRMAAAQVYSRVSRETRGLSIIDGTLKATCLGSEVS